MFQKFIPFLLGLKLFNFLVFFFLKHVTAFFYEILNIQKNNLHSVKSKANKKTLFLLAFLFPLLPYWGCCCRSMWHRNTTSALFQQGHPHGNLLQLKLQLLQYHLLFSAFFFLLLSAITASTITIIPSRYLPLLFRANVISSSIQYGSRQRLGWFILFMCDHRCCCC